MSQVTEDAGWANSATPAAMRPPLAQATLLRLFCISQLKGAGVGLTLCLSSAVLALFYAPALDVLAWLSLVIGSLYLMQRSARRVLAEPGSDANLWTLRLASIGALQSLLLAGLLLLPVQMSTVAHTFLVGTLLMLTCLISLHAIALPIAFHATLAPATLAMAGFLIKAQGTEGLPLTAVLLCAYLCLSLFASQQRAAMQETFSAQADQQSLQGELQRAFERANEARRLAEEASLAKSRFLATMSHELRTPLNAILGFSEVMKNELYGAHVVKAYKDYCNDIHASGSHLLTLINEILDLSRVEAGRYDLQEEAVMLGTVAQECQHLMELRANEREQTIITAIEQTLPGLWADGRALRQVTLNLLSNAIKFTPAGGRIELCVGWTANGGAYLSVRDNGPGIPAEEIPLVLSSFGRGTNAQKSEEAGSGLGLPIAKSLVELHGGRFAIHSKLGQGTQVIAVFPPERVMTQGKKLSAAA